jgi:hypothetical protein
MQEIIGIEMGNYYKTFASFLAVGPLGGIVHFPHFCSVWSAPEDARLVKEQLLARR